MSEDISSGEWIIAFAVAAILKGLLSWPLVLIWNHVMVPHYDALSPMTWYEMFAVFFFFDLFHTCHKHLSITDL